MALTPMKSQNHAGPSIKLNTSVSTLNAPRSRNEPQERARSLTSRVRPHEPGIADGKNKKCEQAQEESLWGNRFAHKRNERKSEADEPGMLIESPKPKRDPAGSEHLL